MGQAAAGGSCQCFCDIFAPSSSSFSSGGCWAAAESGARLRRMNHWDRNNRRRSGRRIEKKLRRWECGGLALFRFFLHTKRCECVCVWVCVCVWATVLNLELSLTPEEQMASGRDSRLYPHVCVVVDERSLRVCLVWMQGRRRKRRRRRRESRCAEFQNGASH
jgi:hypothetical protein